MNRKWLRIALPALCLVLAQCTASSTTTSGPPTAFMTLRLNAANGTGDATFAGGRSIQVTSVDPSLNDFALALTFQPADNKIVVGGSNGLAGQGQIALIRYNADGTLDTTFGGTTGIVKTSLSSPALASELAVQADGKIVVAALMMAPASIGVTTSIVVLRYNTNGTLDTSFNTAGTTPGITAPTPIGAGLASDICAMILQSGVPSEKIVVAGTTQDGKLVLARYDSAGVLDTTFNPTGTTPGTTVTTLTPPSPSNFTHVPPSMAAQSDGRIIVATRYANDQAVLRYSVDGVQDMGFGGPGAINGIVVTDIGGTINYADAVAIQSPASGAGNVDKIVVAGHTNLTDTTFNSSGSTPGIVTTDINNQFDNALAVTTQDFSGSPTKILVSGNTGFGSSTQTIVLRYNADGTADNTFGSRGIGQVFVPSVGPSTISSGNAIGIQPTLGIVVTGFD
jgi:uncharacterized delta-60 repeat protein